ncbi:MAG TPA: tetratricopeptide repeat protein [Vicinamibacterales bacterium]|nr:tetratricopeptide repeat protein [Vicinamibacterales bacterium]
MRTFTIATLLLSFLVVTPAAQQPEATSLSGKPLYRIELPTRVKLEADLAQAEKALAAKPADQDAIVWVGRRQAYLWRYQDAIATFSKGIAQHPNSAKLYRHRAHRYITTRQFDRAIADFEKAAALIKGTKDEIEPDGAPNPTGTPRSSLHHNIWYHLGLAYYLTGDFEKAVNAYRECMKVSTNDDSVAATSDWLWMTLMRLNRKAEADQVLVRITPKMDILENGSYHRRLLMYKGVEKPEALLDPANADDLTIATQGYGVANYYYVTGNRARAREILERVVAGRQWSAFGYIAAEADLARVGR